MPEFFGFQFGLKADNKRKQDEREKNIPSFVAPQSDDGAMEVAPGGVYGTYVDLEGTAKNEAELVTRYRDMALTPEADVAIDDIINEAIIQDDKEPVVSINLDKIDSLSDSVKDKIREEFEYILELMKFNAQAYDIFRRWYVDGRIYYHKMIDVTKPTEGIKELRVVDPRKIRKVREAVTDKDPTTGLQLTKRYKEYYVYNPRGLTAARTSTQGLKLTTSSITYGSSGITDKNNRMVVGHLHKAIKPLNQLKMLEDASVIYRLSRAPERRIFYIDVGNMPKIKAEQHLRDMMAKHKNKLVYDAQTGEVRDDRKFMTMLEDFWLPRRDGNRGTEITTLSGGQNLGEMDDIMYFQKKLYRALNVPVSRLDNDQTFNVGRSSEITRDETKFTKFIYRIRRRFSMVFSDMLGTQLRLKNIVTKAEWEAALQEITYDYRNDNQFTELKDAEIMRERLQLLSDVDQYTGKYYSKKWVRSNVLRMNEEEVDEIRKDIDKEAKEEPDDDFQDQPQGSNSSQPNSAPQPQQESDEILTSEDKQLVESMSKLINSLIDEDRH